MRFLQVSVFLLVSATAVLGREVNRALKEPRSDTDIFRDFFDDDEVIDERRDDTETEILSEDEPEEDAPEEDEPEESNPAGGPGVCGKFDLENFPLRLRDWFYIIMNHASGNNEPEVEDDEEVDGEAPLLPLKDAIAESREDRKFVEGVLWQFCELDKDPRDSELSADELRDFKEPIVPMEPCIEPFLKGCDASGDGQISLKEWGKCLGLEDDEIKDTCNTIERIQAF